MARYNVLIVSIALLLQWPIMPSAGRVGRLGTRALSTRHVQQPNLPFLRLPPEPVSMRDSDFSARRTLGLLTDEERNYLNYLARTGEIRKLTKQLTLQEQVAADKQNQELKELYEKLMAEEQSNAGQTTTKKTLREQLRKKARRLKEQARERIKKSLADYVKQTQEKPLSVWEKSERMGKEKKQAQERLKAQVAALLAAGPAGWYLLNEYYQSLTPQPSDVSQQPVEQSTRIERVVEGLD